MTQRTAPQIQPAPVADPRPVDVETMRDMVRRVLALESTDPQLQDLDALTKALRGHVQLLVPEIRAIIRTQPAGDLHSGIAQIAIGEAWRRLHTTPGFGPDAAYRRAKKLAMSVNSLCDHYENLNPPAH
ncbi:DUF6415 family natural product biosynthesis protein [Streptomyces ficellus]|uniref:DUF6415 family natural product biosynthesis protein n=1 Tax=Streptomyces ficellus TaxID=1977088 RepID=A0ABT7ZBX9_9ACTN|nr:DUF6415 family natural product biosynthesis protein [Streptomyces ficellus]MDN3297000.1 DUF6415 family natural product biosynthesis protein [Streptomyces ficellus]